MCLTVSVKHYLHLNQVNADKLSLCLLNRCRIGADRMLQLRIHRHYYGNMLEQYSSDTLSTKFIHSTYIPLPSEGLKSGINCVTLHHIERAPTPKWMLPKRLLFFLRRTPLLCADRRGIFISSYAFFLEESSETLQSKLQKYKAKSVYLRISK